MNTDQRLLSPIIRWAVVAFALLFPAVITWLYFVQLQESAPWIQQATKIVQMIVLIGLPALFVGLVLRRPVRPLRFTGDGVAVSLLFGMVIAGAMIFLYRFWLQPAGYLDEAILEVREKVRGYGFNTPARYIALAAFYVLFHSLLEEYYWRWFVYGQVRELTRPTVANLVSSVGFMVHHMIVLGLYFGWDSPLTYLFSAATAIGAAVWARIYQRTDTIFGPWLSHMQVDIAIFMIGYVMVFRQAL